MLKAKFNLQKYLILINKNIFINLFNKKIKRFYNKWLSDVEGSRN
jgi:exopolysaccharide biosynthesis predicted pyruvyltransferase EpsI